jgi:DNA primase
MSRLDLSVSELESFDERAPGGSGNRERRFCCPFCGSDKPRDAGHRSLCASLETGAYHCHRCDARGKLRDFWQERPKLSRNARALETTRRALRLPEVPPVKACDGAGWRSNLSDLQPLEGTPGAVYLTGRGLSVDLCERARVRFAPSWFGRPAAVFPSRDAGGALIGAQGRYTDGRDTPKTRTVGSAGVFLTPFALSSEVLTITEAPIDALSLAMAGVPSVAVFGCNLPEWFHRLRAFPRVAIATDADEPGDKAATKWTARLESFGAQCFRLLPGGPEFEGAKDWNGALSLLGAADLRELLSMALD